MDWQADNAKARDLYWKPLSWPVTFRPKFANDAFDPALWTTFVFTTLGLEVPVLSSLPRRNNCPLARLQKTLHGLSRRPHSHMHSSLRCNQGARLDGVCHGPPVPHGRTHCPHAARRNGKRRPMTLRRGDPHLPSGPSGQPEPGLRPVHHARPVWLK